MIIIGSTVVLKSVGKTSNNVLYELLRHFFADTHIYKHTYNIYIYTHTRRRVCIYICTYACNDRNMIRIVIMMTKNAHDNKNTVVYSDSDNDDINEDNHVGITICIYRYKIIWIYIDMVSSRLFVWSPESRVADPQLQVRQVPSWVLCGKRGGVTWTWIGWTGDAALMVPGALDVMVLGPGSSLLHKSQIISGWFGHRSHFRKLQGINRVDDGSPSHFWLVNPYQLAFKGYHEIRGQSMSSPLIELAIPNSPFSGSMFGKVFNL